MGKNRVQYATQEEIQRAKVAEVTNRNVVKVRNDLAFFKHSLTLQEQRLIFIVIAQLKTEDEDFKDYKVHLQDIEEKAGALQSSREVNKFARALMSKTFTIEENNSYITMSWFSSIRKIKGEQAIIVRFDPALKPYLLQLKKNFTKALLSIVLRFKHKYTLQMYLLIKSRISKTLEIEVDRLADILDVPKSYKRNFYDFWRYVIEPAIKEIDDVSDLKIVEVKKLNAKYSKKIAKIVIKAKSKYSKKEIEKINDNELLKKANDVLLRKIIKIDDLEHIITNITKENDNYYIYAAELDKEGLATNKTSKIKTDKAFLIENISQESS